MSAPKHTPEPWHISGIHPRNIHIGSMDSPMVLASMNDVHTQTPANAARIVACVNACAGMDDPAAEIAALRASEESRHYDQAAHLACLRQRDSLAAALREISENDPFGVSSAGKIARNALHSAALAKLDGKS